MLRTSRCASHKSEIPQPFKYFLAGSLTMLIYACEANFYSLVYIWDPGCFRLLQLMCTLGLQD